MFNYHTNTTLKSGSDEIIRNRTLSYLAPAIKFYDSTTAKCFADISVKGVGIGDALLDIEVPPRSLFYLVQVPTDPTKYARAHTYFKTLDNYVTEYSYGELTGNLRMLVITLPSIVRENIIELFIQGKYSELYTPKQIEYIIPKTSVVNKIENYNPIYSILKKSESYEKIFMQKLEKDFGVLPIPYDGRELDYPPNLKMEIFNYQK